MKYTDGTRIGDVVNTGQLCCNTIEKRNGLEGWSNVNGKKKKKII